jgi:hypothetical protein
MSAFYVFAVYVECDDTILVANVNVNPGVLYRGKFRVYSAEKGFGVGVPKEYLGQSRDRPLRILEVDVLGSLTPVGFEDEPTCWTTNTLLILGWANAQFCADLQGRQDIWENPCTPWTLDVVSNKTAFLAWKAPQLV